MHRRSIPVAVGLVLALALVALGPGVVQPERPQPAERTAETVKTVQPADDGTARLWPYTSRGRQFSSATLPINVVVQDDAGTTRRVLASTERWNASSPQGEGVVVNGTGVGWSRTVGADRFTYVETDTGGTWTTATYQLHDGTYLGSRTHLRLYEGGDPGHRWTAIQGHTEYWDWFRLRHTVGSVSEAQYAVEHDLYGTGLIADISRERYGNGGALDADGWVTEVELVEWMVRPAGSGGSPGAPGRNPDSTATAALLAPFVLGVGLAVADLTPFQGGVGRPLTQSRVSRFHVALGLVTVLALPAVRLAGIALDGALPGISPKLVAAPLYLTLAVALPAAVGVLGGRIAADDGFIVAFVGTGAGFVLDYTIVGVPSVPVAILVQRGVLLLALGLIAAGGTRWASDPLRRNRYRIPGVVLWVAGLAWPLVDLL